MLIRDRWQSSQDQQEFYNPLELAAYQLLKMNNPQATVEREGLIMSSEGICETKMKITIPDFLYYLPHSYNVIVEVTGYPYVRGDDPKRAQKDLYRAWTSVYTDYRWIVLFSQNFSSPDIVMASLGLVDRLAMGEQSEKIDRTAMLLAESGWIRRNIYDPKYFDGLLDQVGNSLGQNTQNNTTNSRVNGNAKRKFV